MKRKCFLLLHLAPMAFNFVLSAVAADKSMVIAKAQVPAWTKSDLDFFMHRSMSTEIVPERVLRAFITTYPDLFPTSDLSHFGLIPDRDFGWPVGFSRKDVAHFGGLPSVGINYASCHGGRESDARLYDVAQIGSQPLRPTLFTEKQADLFNNFLAGIETPGYQPASQPGIRSTGKIWAASLDGVWARSPYLHNGSIRTMEELLTKPSDRAQSFHRGSREYDQKSMGYIDEGVYVLDCSQPQNSNAGHDFGTDLSPDQKRELLEYLKTL